MRANIIFDLKKIKRDFSLMVKYVTFNHHYVGSIPTGLKRIFILIVIILNVNRYIIRLNGFMHDIKL